MKTANFILAGIAILTFAFQSCTDEFEIINGQGAIVTQVLDIDDFSSIVIQGVDDVHIQYGAVQQVEVQGHANIINLIERKVRNNTWHMELEDGRYGQYELTYYITLPYVEDIQNSGTGDVYIDSYMSQESIDIHLAGTGSYFGYLLATDECSISISGTGNAETTANSELDVSISGSGSVYYKGNPSIHSNIRGSGKIVNAN